MNSRFLTIIIILTSISLIAALITQLLWVKDAVILKTDQYTNSVRIALKSVVNEIYESDRSYSAEMLGLDSITYWEHADVLSILHPVMLDSLINREFKEHKINEKYVFGVFRHEDSLFILGSYKGMEHQLFHSPMKISLTCLCQSENYLLSVIFPEKKSVLFSELIVLPVMSGLFLLILVFSFFFTIYFIFRQKKLSDMKADFVNNMTHEFKTPISTISVTSEILAKDQVIHSPEKVSKYARIIYDENIRLKNMVERVLQIAIIDKGDYHLKLKEHDVHEIILESIENYKVHVTERNGYIKNHFEAAVSKITVDREHLLNILYNLIDNANKYSPEKPEITVETKNLNNNLLIIVSDKGIGIGKENKEDIFKKFHRLQRGDIHDVKGFGIGLYYVKTMVEKMGGEIKIDSELNKGSTFTLTFPV